MKKNLKKVISAVIALAMSVSSVAMAAPFTDVADTAASANAINALAGLGVITGYEDGTFKPDNNITRAEVATMVVAALNRSADAAGAKGTTKFEDVNTEAKEWASGYVNIGVSEGYISGYEDGTFKPDNNVTYAEMVSMLVRMVGYGQYAEYLGGWPNGYLSVGNDKGITKGVSASQDAAVTRAQVAQMIYNSIVDVCKVSSSGFTTTNDGKLVPSLTIMDGSQNNTRKASDYQTILTEKFDAYYVEGFVTETATTSGLDTYKADEVLFKVRYAENFDDEWFLLKNGIVNNAATGNNYYNKKVNVGTTDAANYLNTYANAIIKVDDDEATIVSFIPSGKNNSVEFASNLYEETNVTNWAAQQTETPYIAFNQTKDASKATKYNLATDTNASSSTYKQITTKMYVNGKAVALNATTFNDYIVNNASGTVEFVDSYDVGNSADNKYDYIYVTYYGTAKVSAVNMSNKGRITFDKVQNANNMYINLDEDDDNKTFEIYYNGEAIEPSALQVGDVLSIKYDVTAGGLAKSEYYEIYVSRDTAEGKYTGQNSGDETVTVGGKDYETVEAFATFTGSNTMKLSYEYTLYLDAFGRIFDVQVLSSAAKYAVVDKFYKKNSGDDYYSVLLYTTEGTTKTAEVDFDASAVKANFADELAVAKKVYNITGTDTTITTAVANQMNTQNKTNIENRVVEYKVSNSSGKITSLSFLTSQGSSTLTTSYNANKMSMGSIKMNDATKIIDATDYKNGTTDATYSNLSVTTPSVLVDDNAYVAFAFGDINKSDKTYPVVVVTSAGGVYSSETMFAVMNEQPLEQTDEDGNEYYGATAFYGNEKVTLKFDDDTKGYNNAGTAVSYSTLEKGDVIVFSKGANDMIRTFDVIATAASLNIKESTLKAQADQSKYFMTQAYQPTAKFTISAARASEFNNWTGAWGQNSNALGDVAGSVDYSKDVTRVVFGPVMEMSSGSFTLGSIGGTGTGNYFTDTADKSGALGSVIDVDVDGDTNVYVYDFSNGINSKDRLTAGGTVSTGASDTYAVDGLATSSKFAWGDETAANTTVFDTVRNAVSFALVRMVDGTAKDVLLIMPDNIK